MQYQTRCYVITANNRLGGMAYFTVLSNIYVGFEVLSSGYEEFYLLGYRSVAH
jgi:hypothetical protein